jgi:hypothetical protein
MNSMMNRTLIWLILLLLVMIGVKFCDYSGVESSSIVGDKLTPSTPNAPESSINSKFLSQSPSQSMDEISLSEDRSHLWDRAHSPILKDLTLGFSSLQKMHSFLDNAPMNGIKIKGRSDALLTVRFAVKDLPTASRFFDNAEDQIEPQFNYRLRTPALPRAEYLEGEKSFGAGANVWLGISEERQDWGRGVKVAVLDSGVDRTHSNLAGIAMEDIDLVRSGDSSKGHGTAVASIIAGNESGQLGLAPATSLLSIRVLNSAGEGDSFTVAEGIVQAVDRGAKVINLSLGGTGESKVLKNAVDYAHRNGALVVAAVGNEGVREVSYPAKFDHVIGVTSVDANGRQSSFANYGEGVDIAAPGVGVFTAWEDEGLVAFSGTSTATAFISGALAAEISKNPGLSNAEVVDLLYNFANESEKPGIDKFTGKGILNVGRIDNRNVPNLHDAAIVGYYFDPEHLKGGTTPFQVLVQNQGTSRLDNLSLQVEYRGVVRNFFLNNLTPGDTRSEKLFLDGSVRGGDGVRISSKIFLNGVRDIKPENNNRVSTISLPSL